MNLKRLLVVLFAAVTLAIAQTKPAAKATAGKTSPASAKSSALIDINSASATELESLPGVGPATAQKIIAGRPYRAKSDLTARKIVSASTYAKIKDQIIAHQMK